MFLLPTGGGYSNNLSWIENIVNITITDKVCFIFFIMYICGENMEMFKMIFFIPLMLIVMAFLTLMAAAQFVITNDVSQPIYISYVSLLLLVLISFVVCCFVKRNKICCAILLLSLFGSLAMYNFNEEIVLANKKDSCLDSGLVWDGEQKRCRNDCLTWRLDTGCVPLQD